MACDRKSTNSRMMLLVLALAAVGVINGGNGEIIKDPTLCGRTKCKVPAERKFKYAEGTVYRYQYGVDVSTSLGARTPPSSSRKESTLHVDATVSIRFASPCEGNLKFSNVSISHDRSRYNAEFPDRAGAEFKANLERHVLRFAFDDGQVHELCPDDREPTWALNLKRGALSMLQNTMKRFDIDRQLDELDVNGICHTTYKLHEAKRTSLIIRKTKNLAGCSFGARHLSIVQSLPYRSPRSDSEHSGHALLRSDSECEITIDHNVYERVVCRDVHRLRPLSNGENAGARTETVATLQLYAEDKEGHLNGSDDDEEYEDNEDRYATGSDSLDRRTIRTKRTNLLYDHAKTSRTMHGELRTARDLLKSMCKLGANGEELQQRFSEVFTDFVHAARLLDHPSLWQLFARANGICKNGEKHIVRALPFMGSNPAVIVMKDLIVQRFVDQRTINDWVTAFALIPRPDRNTVKAIAPLLEIERNIPDAQFVLSYSAVVHAYCVNDRANCAQLEQVRRFLTHLEQRIEEGCEPRFRAKTTVKETLEALKAVGNMGLETESLLRKLKGCIDDASGFVPMEVRVAAVDAHRRLPSCEGTRDRFFLDYYRNFTLDSEIRIASYLQVMRCPDYSVVKTIKHALRSEQVNQVGSFVWSHLTNLYNSASPTRVEIQSLLTDRDLGSKFNSDLRKFSRNYDGSFFSEDYNLGASYQSNVIFSPKSYIPRTASFNVTLDLLGESVNLFEVTARMEGLEYYAENLFGPDGPYSNEKVSNHVNSFLRSFRAAPEDDDYWKRVERLPNVIDNNFDNPTISLSYKIFGNELKYTMLNGDKEIRATLASLNPWTKIKEILSGQEIRYENTAMFMDSTYVVPTTAGLPVRLDISGSAACNFKMSGLLDTKRIANAEMEFSGNIMPSASVDVVGSVTVDAFYKSAGIKLRTNVYSSGALQVHLNLKGARLARVSLGLPSKRTEVFSVYTDVLLTRGNGADIKETALGVLLTDENDKDARQLTVPGTVIRNTTCSWAALDRLIGLKFCTDYQFPNVTKDPNASYFILNGPTLFKLSLIKADPTAKNYVVEYTWRKTEEQSVLKLAFDTPRSQVNRELSATISFDVRTHNVTVLLHSAGNSLLAKGTYKRTENETFIDIGFDANGTKHLDASMGYTTKKFTHGYTYNPTFQLTINSERVAAISGTIRSAQKNNVSQCDIDLTFQTKKVWSRLVGYIVRRNISLAGDFQLDYQLQKMPRKETLHLEASLINRSSRTLAHKAADLKLHSTAYPQLNTVVNVWYQQALGHLELHAEVNSSPHLKDNRHKLTAQLVVSYSKVYFHNQGTKVNVLFAITKPIQNLDIKVGVNHYAAGVESRTTLLIGYAPGKEISLVVHLVTPPGLLSFVEAHANLTIPNFNSLLIDARITERSRREYDLDFAGTWFSGHNVTARGTYSDRSSPAIISHNLKLILKSPSFANDIVVNCKLFHGRHDLRISLYMEHIDSDKYAFVLNHTLLSPTQLTTYVEARHRNSVYSALADVDTEREVRVELHMDKWRDVHLTLTGINEEASKVLGAELMWDANRDPALKIATTLRLSKHVKPASSPDRQDERNFGATITFTYPERLVAGKCLIAVRGLYNYRMDTSLEWSPEKVIDLTLETGYDVQSSTRSMKLETQLLTPFECWKRTAFNARYLQLDYKIAASSSAYWKDSQYIVADFHGSTNETGETTEWAVNSGLTSTVHAIGWITANVTHKTISTHTMDTRALVKYHPDKVIDARSTWHLDKASDAVFNLTGNVHLESPLTNYKVGDLLYQLRVMPDWKFAGAANLDLDKRKYAASLIGDVARLKESTVRFNLTTPLERYAFVRGRFGLSESDKHLVAEIVTPSGPLGVEAICQLFTATHDLNAKLLVATPTDILQRAMLIAKLSRREADFRVAYNKMTAGFEGVWHYNNITDFHYTYILYTPLDKLEESGIVTKLIVARTEPDGRLDVDTEFSVRLGDTKLGVRAKAGPKAPPIRIPMKTDVKLAKAVENKEGEGESEEEDEELDEEDCSYWRGELEIYPAIMEHAVGELDIDSEGPLIKIVGSFSFANNKILLHDNFWIEDAFHMKNDLSIDTPFAFANEIVSFYVFNIDMENSIHVMQTEWKIRRNTTWFETGLSANYTYHESELDDSKTHIVKVNIKTPLEFMKYVETRTVVDIDENFYKANIAIRAKDCLIDLIGSTELEEAFVDAVLSIKVNSSELMVPKTKITAKKDFSDKEKQIKFGLTIEEPVEKSTKFQIAWQIEDENYVKASLALDTWLEPVRNIETKVLYVDSIDKNGTSTLNASFRHRLDQEYKLIGNFDNGTIDVTLRTPIPANENFQFHGDLVKINETSYRVEGDLKNLDTSALHRVSTDITTANRALSALDMTIRPKSGGRKTDEVTIRLQRRRYGLTVESRNYIFNGTLDLNCINALNWDVRMQGDHRTSVQLDDKDAYRLTTYANVQVSGNTTLYLHAETPWRDVERLTFNGNLLLSNTSGDVRVDHRLNGDHWHGRFQWTLVYMIDMFGRVTAGCELADVAAKDVDARVFFGNPGGLYRNLATGFDIDIDREKWKFATNASIGFRNLENVDAVVSVRLPPPNNDDHRLLISYHANRKMQDLFYVVGYNAMQAQTNYASDGSLRMANRDIDGHLRVTWGMLPTQAINNLFNVTFDKKEVELKYSLYSPKFLQEETVVVLFNYDGTHDEYNLINTDIFYPAKSRVATARISYESLVNVNGTVNATTPIPHFPYAGCNFVVLTTLKQNKRFVKFFWPNNTALLNSEYSYHSERLNSNLDGSIRVEVPLNTRHVGHLTYGYKKRPQVTTGYSVLTYNGQKVVNAQYNSKSESRAGFEKDRIQITMENVYTPIGIVYTSQYEYSGGNEGTNYPTVEFKQANIYRLDNSSLFNITGESRIRTTHTGQDVRLKATHSNRTIQLNTDYQIVPGEFDHHAWLSLAEDAWIAYRVDIVNKTTDDVDNQFLIVNVAYPRRNFSLDGSYRITGDELNSEGKLAWDKDTDNPRTIGTAFDWRNLSTAETISRQQAVFSLRHPSFARPVTVTGETCKRDPRDLLNAALTVDYSLDADKRLLLSVVVRDESDPASSDRRYAYNITGRHPSTRFDLEVAGYARKHGIVLVETENRGRYKRSFLPEEQGRFDGRVDRARKEVLFRRESSEVTKRLALRYYPAYPRYVVNGSVVNTPELNATGAFFFDPREKLAWMMVNYTPDAVESLRMYGKIPDARNAAFDVWRTYDQDLSVSDVAFYLKLNHSRLVTSTLRWRPELRNDVIAFLKDTAADMYNNAQKDADYWKQYIKSETVSVISDVWDDAQEDLSEFLGDWNDLKSLETDLDDLKIYLNDSYNANDFYIKDVVTFCAYVIDELSLRSHIESLPNILNEIWEIMGESGEAIRRSLLWIIETIKTAYDKASEVIAAVLRGDSVSQVADIIERLIEKYDMLIKDLHVSFIKYIENLWQNIATSISQQWYRFLKLVEPLFIRFLHYLETVAWRASKEVVDFLYDRKNDIIASPYFDRFTNFTQDVDRIYKDVKGNDIVTNVQKYTGLIIKFLRERYFAFVPFGKELKDVVDEIASEIRELRKLPSVHYALDKLQAVYDRAYYLYEYLEVKAKIESVVRLVHSKLVDIGQTALQTENRYREAKTKFIFDPNQGLMCLEQKLPMSWHAFNQTPEFQEIPEYRAIADLRSYFVTSNTTFWSLYYRYKPYTEPSNWLPPFKAQAMIIGSKHYTTFDGRYFDFVGSCTYLLARDFVHNTFAILVKYGNESDRPTHRIIVLIGQKAIEVDIFEDNVRLISNTSSGKTSSLQLPIELENGTAYVYQEENVVIIERKGKHFRLECNLKFDLCTLDLSGWYYGKTAGLLGTMDNEPMNDMLGSNGAVHEDVESFARGWAIDDDCPDSSNLENDERSGSEELLEFCDELFANKTSEFSSCFGVVDPREYSKMCSSSVNQTEACTVTMSYMQTCMFRDTYLRIPDRCTTCTMIDGTLVAEGEFQKLEGDSVPRSADVVFIVEAKECNRDVRQNRSIEHLVGQLSKELQDQGLDGNRWSLVVFGGNGVYDRPRSVVLDGRIFTKNAARFVDAFDHVPVGDGNQDVFAAIGFASQLVFRAGVSKTFVLMPCSRCESENQTLDYSVIHHVLLEYDIRLHILTDGEFEFEKERLGKIFYGLDATRSYTKKDTRTLSGDVDARRQVKLSKTALGYCTPLALETNGTIFSASKLRFDKIAAIKKFVGVFAKRVVLTARPSPCQHCECTADNNGVTQMECMPCVYPTPVTVDYETFNFNESLYALQPLDVNYGQLDFEDG